MKNELDLGILKQKDIILVKNKNPLSKVILKHMNYSHSETVFEILPNNNIITIGAKGLGVRLINFKDYFDGKEIKVLRRNEFRYKNLTIDEEFDFLRKARQTIGLKYDYPALLCHQLHYIKTGEWIGKTEQEAAKRFYCFELSAYLNEIDEFWKQNANSLEENNNFYTVYAGKFDNIKK